MELDNANVDQQMRFHLLTHSHTLVAGTALFFTDKGS